MTAPEGAVVKLYVDLWEPVAVGDTIRTESGRSYRALTVRTQERGKHRGRQHLTCLVLEPGAPALPGTMVHTIRWYKRSRARSR